jgi:hypothetical protein
MKTRCTIVYLALLTPPPWSWATRGLGAVSIDAQALVSP